MDAPATCPRGHPVEPDAVLCTVCWVRLDGEDPASKRSRILDLPIKPTSAAVVGGIVLAAGVGAALLMSGQSAPAAVVAVEASPTSVAPAPSSSPAAPTPSPSATDQSVVTSVPLAATVTDPVSAGTDEACVLATLDQQVPCRAEGDLVRFEVCVPGDTGLLEVRGRQSKADEWEDVPADVVLLTGGGCASDAARADIAVTAATFASSDSKWRLVGRDDAGEKLWKSKITAAEG